MSRWGLGAGFRPQGLGWALSCPPEVVSVSCVSNACSYHQSHQSPEDIDCTTMIARVPLRRTRILRREMAQSPEGTSNVKVLNFALCHDVVCLVSGRAPGRRANTVEACLAAATTDNFLRPLLLRAPKSPTAPLPCPSRMPHTPKVQGVWAFIPGRGLGAT